VLRLIVGLGNPGSRYEGSRHNVGFQALDALRSSWGLPDYQDKFSGAFTRGERGASPSHPEAVALLKPMTFMNLSGSSVQQAMAFLKVDVGSVVVLHDELDLGFGDVRVKVGGGHAGHNGIRSLIERVSSSDFVRVRIGVGRPPPTFGGDVADYVLSRFDPVERTELPKSLTRAIDAVEWILSSGPEMAMTRVNARTPGTGRA
jgi:PTH1 family peptidyl-tRNA hydrolase